MKTLPANASDEGILSLMHEWVNLLAEEKYEDARHYFVNEEHNVWNWSPAEEVKYVSDPVFIDAHHLLIRLPSGESQVYDLSKF